MKKSKIKNTELVTATNGPMTMSKIGQDKKYVIAEIVVAFKDKNAKKLLSICKRENIAKNGEQALFALLCWFHLLLNKKVEKADMALGPNKWEREEKEKKCLADLAMISEPTNLLFILFPYYQTKNIDINFFETKEEDYFYNIYCKSRELVMENTLQHFFPNSYYFNGEDSSEITRKAFTRLYAAFLSLNILKNETNQEAERLGNEWLDRVMVFTLNKEGVLNTKWAAGNRTARFRVYEYFLRTFAANHVFPFTVRNSWNHRLGIWLNVEEYIVANGNLFEGRYPKLKNSISIVVDSVHKRMITGKPLGLMLEIKSSMEEFVLTKK